jgi:hypothetical protein
LKKSKQNLLYEKYPRFFVNRDSDPSKSPMCWGIATGDGWYDLIDRAIGKIEELYQKLDPKEISCSCQSSPPTNNLKCWRCDGTGTIKITAVGEQIKEKFGGLRLYISNGTPEMHQVLDAVEEESSRICEDCGKPGQSSTRKGGYWLATLCSDHAGKDRDWSTESE